MKNRQAFTIIEIIMTIVLMGIFMYAGISIFINASGSSIKSNLITISESLAEGKIEQVMAMPFAQISSEAETNYSGDLSPYSSQVIVNYVSGEALDTTVATSEYKRIRVQIRNVSLANPVEISTIRANY